MRYMFFAFVMLFACSTASAQGVYFTAQGMHFGEKPTKEFVKANGMTAEDLQKELYYTRHVIEVPGGEIVQRLGFVKGQFETMNLTFASELFDEVVAIYAKRLGAQPTYRTEPFVNRLGARFENKIAFWQTDAGLLKIQRFGGTLDRGFGAIFSKSYLQADKANRDQKQLDASAKF